MYFSVLFFEKKCAFILRSSIQMVCLDHAHNNNNGEHDEPLHKLRMHHQR